MTGPLQVKFVIPKELMERVDPFRIHACDLITVGEQKRAAALEKMQPWERAAMESEISYLTLQAKILGVDSRLFVIALRKILLEIATSIPKSGTLH